MCITNFVPTGSTTWRGRRNYTYATIDVTTGMFWWRKTETKRIYRDKELIYWHFVDTGKYTPNLIVEQLEAAYYASNSEMAEKEGEYL